jgi:phage shock protein C
LIAERRNVMQKKLYKSNKDKKIDGVCAGIAEYFDIDPTLVRLGAVAICLAGGSGVLAYIIAAIIMPRDPN